MYYLSASCLNTIENSRGATQINVFVSVCHVIMALLIITRLPVWQCVTPVSFWRVESHSQSITLWLFVARSNDVQYLNVACLLTHSQTYHIAYSVSQLAFMNKNLQLFLFSFHLHWFCLPVLNWSSARYKWATRAKRRNSRCLSWSSLTPSFRSW